MKAYSVDLRKRVVEAAVGGLPRSEVVRLFGVSLATLKRWLVQHQNGDLAPKPIPGKKRSVEIASHERLRQQLQNHPDATLEEHRRLWQQEQGQVLSRATMARTILRLGYTRKKRA